MKKPYLILGLIMACNLILGSYVYGNNNAYPQSSEPIISTGTQEIEDLGINQEINLDVIAKQLNNLGILTGTEKGFELERGLTRAEAAVIITKLSGGDMYENMEEKLNHGFIDVPEWANIYVGHLKYIGAVNGITDTEYGSNIPMSSQQFTTMVLRVLDYSDINGDFLWNKSLDKALEINLIDKVSKERIDQSEIFTRGDMALITYNALFQIPKGNDKRLLQLQAKAETGKGLTSLFSIDLTQEEIVELSRSDRTWEEFFDNNPDKFKEFESKLINHIRPALNFYSVYYNGEEYTIKLGDLVYVSELYGPSRLSLGIETSIYYKGIESKSTMDISYSLINNKLVPWSDNSWRVSLGSTVASYLSIKKNKIDIQNKNNKISNTNDWIDGNHLNEIIWIKYDGKDLEKYAIMFDDNNPKIVIENYK